MNGKKTKYIDVPKKNIKNNVILPLIFPVSVALAIASKKRRT